MEGESGVRNKDNGLVGWRFKDQVTWIHNRRPICLYHVITLEWSDFGCKRTAWLGVNCDLELWVRPLLGSGTSTVWA